MTSYVAITHMLEGVFPGTSSALGPADNSVGTASTRTSQAATS